jgi:hypothetical protein
MDSCLELMDELKLPNRDKQKNLYENSAKLFKLSAKDSPYEKGALLDRLR